MLGKPPALHTLTRPVKGARHAHTLPGLTWSTWTNEATTRPSSTKLSQSLEEISNATRLRQDPRRNGLEPSSHITLCSAASLIIIITTPSHLRIVVSEPCSPFSFPRILSLHLLAPFSAADIELAILTPRCGIGCAKTKPLGCRSCMLIADAIASTS